MSARVPLSTYIRATAAPVVMFGWFGWLAARVYESAAVGVVTFVLLVSVLAIGIWARLRRLHADQSASAEVPPQSGGSNSGQG